MSLFDAVDRRSRHRWRSTVAVTIVLVTAGSRVASAQDLDTVLTIAGGAGLSLGQGDGEVLTRASPLFLDVDVGLIFDSDRSLEWTPSLIMELQGRVSVGVNPSLKRVWRVKSWLSIYGGIGFPLFFAPFTLLGVEPAVGAFFQLLPRFGLAVELHSDVFFVGSDLPEDSVVAKMDLSVGVRFDL